MAELATRREIQAELDNGLAPDKLMFKPLEELEEILENRARGYVVDGLVLKAVRDGYASSGRRGKFRDSGYPTFKDYCRKEWNIDSDRASHLIITAGAMYEMVVHSPRSPRPKLPVLASHAEYLARVKDADLRLKVWDGLVERVDRENRTIRSITEAEVREAVLAAGVLLEQPKALKTPLPPAEKLVKEFMHVSSWLEELGADVEEAAAFAVATLPAEDLEVQVSAGHRHTEYIQNYVGAIERALNKV